MKTARKQPADSQAPMEKVSITVPKPIAEFIRLDAKRNRVFDNDGTTFERCVLNAISGFVEGQLDGWRDRDWVGTEFDKDWQPALRLLRETMGEMSDESPWKMAPDRKLNDELGSTKKLPPNKSRKKPFAALVALAVLLFGASVQAQVQVTPTHYTHTVSGLNSVGTKLFRSCWITEYTDAHILTLNRLVVSQTVYYDSVRAFWQLPKKIEHRYMLHGSGGWWFLTNAQRIEWLAPKADDSGWIIQARDLDIDDSQAYRWHPEMTGRVTTGNEYWRTIETGTGLDCMAVNSATTPRLVTLPCRDGSDWFNYTTRLAPGERKFITIGGAGLPFRFDFGAITDEPTL